MELSNKENNSSDSESSNKQVKVKDLPQLRQNSKSLILDSQKSENLIEKVKEISQKEDSQIPMTTQTDELYQKNALMLKQ